ncbi:MAG: CPBP family intramembrane metalloprotease [Planctomycetaceae bacterium]|nr:CPBP family intramembrane metalloprotease [Planctomycetaceae bacterium]
MFGKTATLFKVFGFTVKADEDLSPHGTRRCRMERLLEVSVFVFLILPSLLLSFVSVGVAGPGGMSFALGGTAIIFRDMALVSLVLFFIWRNREPIRRIGWSFRCCWRDVGLGMMLFIPTFFAAGWVEQAAKFVGLSPGPKSLPADLTPHGGVELALASVMVVVVALAEETIFRGYLILRFAEITGSGVAAVLLSSFIFALGHGYEGSAGVVTVGFMGLVFAMVFLWRKSLLAPIVMHFMQDFLAIVAIPLMGIR